MKTKPKRSTTTTTTSKAGSVQLDRAFDAAITLRCELAVRHYAAQLGVSVAATREIVNVIEGSTEPGDQERAESIFVAGDLLLARRLRLAPDGFSQWLEEYDVLDGCVECPRDLVTLPALRRVADMLGVSLN